MDTNVLLYVLGDDEAKASRTEAIVLSRPTISIQVLNEFANAALRKHALTIDEIGELLEPVRRYCAIESVTLQTHDLARSIAGRYRYGFYDCVIIAAALLAQCDVLYSEDLHDGQVIEGSLTIHNPFKS